MAVLRQWGREIRTHPHLLSSCRVLVASGTAGEEPRDVSYHQRVMCGQRMVMKSASEQIYGRTVSSRVEEGTRLVLGGLGGALEEATAT